MVISLNCLFRKISRNRHVWVQFYYYSVFGAVVLLTEDQDGERTSTPAHVLRPPSWDTPQLHVCISMCLRLDWTRELPCACLYVCVARVNQPS